MLWVSKSNNIGASDFANLSYDRCYQAMRWLGIKDVQRHDGCFRGRDAQHRQC